MGMVNFINNKEISWDGIPGTLKSDSLQLDNFENLHLRNIFFFSKWL